MSRREQHIISARELNQTRGMIVSSKKKEKDYILLSISRGKKEKI
jgi:hypothetical protein